MMIADTPPAMVVPDCRAAAIRLSTRGDPGEFNGMSHSGTLIVLRNVGRRTCRVPGLPQIGFLDSRGHLVPAAREAPVGMHPGPVVLPVAIEPGGVVSTPLLWVAGPVYDTNRCYQAHTITVTFGKVRLRVAGGGNMCAPAGKPVGFNQPVLRPGTSTSA